MDRLIKQNQELMKYRETSSGFPSPLTCLSILGNGWPFLSGIWGCQFSVEFSFYGLIWGGVLAERTVAV